LLQRERRRWHARLLFKLTGRVLKTYLPWYMPRKRKLPQELTELANHYSELPYRIANERSLLLKEMNSEASYLFEPAMSLHTLTVDGSTTEPTEVWFAIYGTNINLDDGVA